MPGFYLTAALFQMIIAWSLTNSGGFSRYRGLAWVRDRSPMCKHITAPQVTALVAAGLVTEGQLRAAGLAA